MNAPFDPELSDDGDDRDYKMVFVVNAGLGMGVGKIAAQVRRFPLLVSLVPQRRLFPD